MNGWRYDDRYCRERVPTWTHYRRIAFCIGSGRTWRPGAWRGDRDREPRAAAPTSRQTTRRAFPSSKPGVSQSSEPVKLSRVSLPSLLGRRAGVVEKGNRWEQGDQNFCPSFWTDFMCMA